MSLCVGGMSRCVGGCLGVGGMSRCVGGCLGVGGMSRCVGGMSRYRGDVSVCRGMSRCRGDVSVCRGDVGDVSVFFWTRHDCMMRGAINIKWFNNYLTINTDLKGRRKIWERGENSSA